MYDSDEQQYMKRQCEEPITPGPAVEVGTRVIIASVDQNHKKLGTVVGFKRNGWYQIGLDENPFNPVRYRFSSLQLMQGGSFSGFVDDAPQTSTNPCTPADESEVGFADDPVSPVTPATPGGTSTSVYSRGTRVQMSHSHKKGTITGYKGGGWYFVHVDEDREVSMLRRGGFHILDHIRDDFNSEDAAELRFPKDRIEQCILSDSTTVERFEEDELQLLRHEIKTMRKKAGDLKAAMCNDIASLDMEMNRIVTQRCRNAAAQHTLVLDAALSLLGPKKSRGLETSWGVPWVKPQEMLIEEDTLSDSSESEWSDDNDECDMPKNGARCRSVGHCPQHGRIHTYSSDSDQAQSDDDSQDDSNSVNVNCFGDDLSADEGVEEISADEEESDATIDDSDCDSVADEEHDGTEANSDAAEMGEICGSINTRRNRPCQRVGFCPYHGGRADSKLPARPNGAVHPAITLQRDPQRVIEETVPETQVDQPDQVDNRTIADEVDPAETTVPHRSPVGADLATPTRRKIAVEGTDVETPVTKKMFTNDMAEDGHILLRAGPDEQASCEGDELYAHESYEDAVLDTPLDKANDLLSSDSQGEEDEALAKLREMLRQSAAGVIPGQQITGVQHYAIVGAT